MIFSEIYFQRKTSGVCQTAVDRSSFLLVTKMLANAVNLIKFSPTHGAFGENNFRSDLASRFYLSKNRTVTTIMWLSSNAILKSSASSFLMS